MEAWALSPPDTAAWLQVAVGAAVFVLPGLAVADRIFPRSRLGLLLAPVFSFTVLALASVVLDTFLGVPLTAPHTALLALAIAAAAGLPRIVSWIAPDPAEDLPRAPRGRWRPWLLAGALLLVFAFLALVHAIPHLPGEAPASASEAYPELLGRARQGIERDHYPYAIHVDEHIHMAWMAQIMRQRTIHIDDPYTQEPYNYELFSVTGMRSERGWQTGLVHLVHLTELSLPALFRFLPALWAGYLGVVTWLTLRPAPGALASAAFVATLPTTVRFLGVGFLVPSAFALPWILAVIHVALRARGGKRFLGMVLLITGAHFMHMVPGVLTIVAGLFATLVGKGSLRDRLALLASVLLPLLWIVPPLWHDAVAAVGSAHTLPFAQHVFAVPGLLLYALALAGVVAAVALGTRDTAPHRALLGLLLVITALMAISIMLQHRNDATYSRLVPTFFLCIAALGGLGLAVAARTAFLRAPQNARRIGAGALVAAVAAAALAFPVQAHLSEPYYRVFDDEAWRAGIEFAAVDPGGDAVFLSDPWRAPLFNALTGAMPHTVLRPGSPPANGEDWAHYMRTGGADGDWLEARGITHVVAAVAPNAPHEQVGRHVFVLG